MKSILTCLAIMAALVLLLVSVAQAVEGSNPCMILQPSGGPSIRVEVNNLCETSSESGTISWQLSGKTYSFNVTGYGQGWSDQSVHCKLNLHGSDSTAGNVAMFTAVITVNGTRANTASITWTDVSYDISLINFKGNDDDQEYTGSGPIVNCD
jgi:hypothetical protein